MTQTNPPPSLEIHDLLANYQPRESPFEIPPNAETTDDIDATYKGDHVPYTIDPSSRAAKVTHKDVGFLSNAGVRGMVTNVSHGTFQSRPASLIIFSFSLRSGDHGFRFKNATVKITFDNPSSVRLSSFKPSVIKFAPRKIFGLPTIEGRRNRIGGEISLEVPVGPLTVGPSIHGHKEWEYEKEHRFQLIGKFWSSKQETYWDIVYWEIKENRRTKYGIPDQLNVAVVVERDGAFTASVEVTVDTPLFNGIFGFPWSKNNPVAFVPEVVMGEQPRTTKFDELRDEEWRALIPYEDEWQDKFTEVALGQTSGDYTPVLRAVKIDVPIFGEEDDNDGNDSEDERFWDAEA
ncbi:hypothetical protein B7494_g3966 [Chlorociboria aeruginascens]|nr:hypothetical protein B7494_g3966 [Chlorociboria aeruginascens]